MTARHHDGDLGTLLAVFAHPDDEAYLAGGLMAVATDAGRRVVCVTATKGERGFPDDEPRSLEERAAVREAEMHACLAVLGVGEHHWLDLPDGGCADLDDAGPVGRLCELLEEVQPDTVLTFGPDGQTYHPDHITISRWTTRAVQAAGEAAQPQLLYAAMTPEWLAEFSKVVPLDQVMMADLPPSSWPADDLAVWFHCDDELAARKISALRAQASQIEPLLAVSDLDTFTRLNADEFYRRPTVDDWPH